MKSPSRRLIYVILTVTVLAGVGGVFLWYYTTSPRVIDLQTQTGLAGRATYRVFGWHKPLSSTTTRFHVVTMPDNAMQADLWFNAPETEPANALLVNEVARANRAVFAINGGYFTDGFTPSGLAMDDGEQLQPSSDEAVLSGFIAISERGGVQLIPRAAGLPPCEEAVQAGPFLIDPGGQLGIHSDDLRSQRRSVIAISSDGQLVLIVADAISLYQLAMLLHDRPGLFGVKQIDRALNLDGGPSTALYVDLGGPFDLVPANGPVQNFILFSER